MAACFLSIAPAVCAAPCTQSTPPNVPCTPVPGPATDDAKDNIVKFIKSAQRAKPVVMARKAAYMAVRDNPMSLRRKN